MKHPEFEKWVVDRYSKKGGAVMINIRKMINDLKNNFPEYLKKDVTAATEIIMAAANTEITCLVDIEHIALTKDSLFIKMKRDLTTIIIDIDYPTGIMRVEKRRSDDKCMQKWEVCR